MSEMAKNQNGAHQAAPQSEAQPGISEVMGGLPVPDAAEMAKVAARWMEARERDARRKARMEVWARRMSKVRNIVVKPWKKLEYSLEIAGRRIREPFDDMLLAFEKWQAERRAKQLAYFELMAPQREEAARKKWEKRKKRHVAMSIRLAVWRERLDVLGEIIAAPFHKIDSFGINVKDFILAPYREMLIKREQMAEERRKKIQEMMGKDRGMNDEKIRAKHMKMMEKMMIRKERARRRRERLDFLYQWMRSFGKLWRNTAPIRKLIYLIILCYAIFHYRLTIAQRFGSVLGFDLQSLMK